MDECEEIVSCDEQPSEDDGTITDHPNEASPSDNLSSYFRTRSVVTKNVGVGPGATVRALPASQNRICLSLTNIGTGVVPVRIVVHDSLTNPSGIAKGATIKIIDAGDSFSFDCQCCLRATQSAISLINLGIGGTSIDIVEVVASPSRTKPNTGV